jgi:hypothetical protein
VFADGSVQNINYGIDRITLQRLGHRKDGLVVDWSKL